MPGLWLGWLYGRRGAYVSIGFVIAFAVAPAAIYFGFTRETLFRSLFVTVVSAAAALLIAISLEKAQAAEARANQRGEELTDAIATIEHQRRMAEAILESVDVGLVLLDSTGRYQQTNRRHLELLDLAFPDGHSGNAGDPGEIYGPDGTRLIGGAELPSVRALLGNEFDDERIWIGSDPLTRRAVSVSARRVLDDRGRFNGAALAYKDVTDYVNLLKVKDEFLASVSHELRTPLTSIMGYVDLLIERDDLPPEVQQHLAVVERNSTRLLSLVADLLHTAQIDQGPMQVVRQPADLAEIARQSVGAAEPHALGAGIKVELHTPDELWASVDAQRIAQVFDNLISNAIKYTPQGGRVSVGLSLDLDRVVIEVADTGIGIEASDRDRLFTRFFRARDAEARSIQGVGLGLSVLKSIVDSHGGRVEVDSQLGVGSTFRVRLPLEMPTPTFTT